MLLFLSNDLDTLAQQLYDLNDEKGWHEDDITNPCVLACKLWCIDDELREVSEAENLYEISGDGKPDGKCIEYVDVLWRMWDLVVWLGFKPTLVLGQPTPLSLAAMSIGGGLMSLGIGDPVTRWLGVRNVVNSCIRIARSNGDRHEIVNKLMSVSIQVVGELALAGQSLDMEPAEFFAVKYKYNAGRPHRHGGKAF